MRPASRDLERYSRLLIRTAKFKELCRYTGPSGKSRHKMPFKGFPKWLKSVLRTLMFYFMLRFRKGTHFLQLNNGISGGQLKVIPVPVLKKVIRGGGQFWQKIVKRSFTLRPCLNRCVCDSASVCRVCFWFFKYFIQNCFGSRPSDPLCRRMLALNPGLLRFWHWQLDAVCVLYNHSDRSHPLIIATSSHEGRKRGKG